MTDDDQTHVEAEGETVPLLVDGEEPNQQLDDHPDGMTEQIEAEFGPMAVYVSGTETESVQQTFDDVWDKVMETYERVQEMKDDDEEDGPGHGRTFG